MEIFITAHVNYDYEELYNELEEICRIRNEPLDDFFQRVMQIYYRFLESDKPSDQEILDWFSYLLSIPEGDNLENEKVSNLQDIISQCSNSYLHNEYSVTSHPEKYFQT
jgi:hypothetical protein